MRYQAACSLDGYIAGPRGEIDWITGSPDFDFGALFEQFDTLLMGRRTYEDLPGGLAPFAGKRILVASRTLRQEEHPGVEVVGGGLVELIERLRREPGRDIWLFGGGALFRSLLEADQVDSVEPAIIPVVLGGGVPMFPAPGPRRRLRLVGERSYVNGGMVLLEYAVEKSG